MLVIVDSNPLSYVAYWFEGDRWYVGTDYKKLIKI